jgi:D-aspartate ligase
MLQEYIPGGVGSSWMFNGYFDAMSDCLVAFTGQKLRQLPPATGSATLGVCVANEAVEIGTKEFLKRLNYRGIVDLGYRYDERDGVYKLYDVNPRIGATFRLFVGANGVDVSHALYLDLTGQPVPDTTLVPGRKWVVEISDVISSYQGRRERNLSFRGWLQSFRGVKETAWFAGDDPFPFALVVLQTFTKAVSRIVRKMRRG